MASDNFTNTDGTLLTDHNSKWKIVSGYATISILGNAARCNITWGNTSAYFENGQGNDQSSEIVLKAYGASTTNGAGVILQANPTSQGYRVSFSTLVGANFTAISVYRNGVWQDAPTGVWPWNVDHKLKAILSSGNIAIYVDDILIDNGYTDGTPLTGGYPGIALNTGTNGANDIYVDNWTDGISDIIPFYPFPSFRPSF